MILCDRQHREVDTETATARLGRRRLPSFLDHFSVRELKIFFRCWVALWAASLLIFIGPSLASLGTATFFACMVLIILPPSGLLFVYILGALSLFIGICLAWAWGIITMKAALAIRSDAETQSRLASLQQAAAIEAKSTGSSVSGIAQRMIFDGWMLDARARLRAANPKSALTAIFGIIISDIFLIYGPLLPSFNGTLPLSLVKPAASGVGIGLACSLLFFPQSTSDITLGSMEVLLRHLEASVQSSATTLKRRSRELDMKPLQNCRVNIIEEYQKLEPSFAFLPMDFSIGSWGAEAVQKFKEPVRQLVAAVLALSEFHISMVHTHSQAHDLQHFSIDASEDTDDEKKTHKIGQHQLSQLAKLLKRLQYTEDHSFDQDVVDKLTGLSTSAINVCLEGLSITGECLRFINRQHWYRRVPNACHEDLYQQSNAVLAKLRETRTTFLDNMTEVIISGYEPLLQNFRDQSDHANQLAGLIICMNFQEHVANALDKTEALMACMSIEFPNALQTRVWWPISIKYAAEWMVKKKGKAPTTLSTSEDDPTESLMTDATKAAQNKLRIRRGYRPKTRHPLGKAITGTYHWFTSDEGMYAIRMVAVTIAVSIPAVLPSSAGFFYREKGFWGLVMGQTSVLVYMADYTFSLMARLCGTIGGGLLGLVAWYVGSGDGPGNPYGLAAVFAVILCLLLWLRLYLPPFLVSGAIMSSATFLLVVSYSYVDSNNPTYGNPGVGYNVFWRRLLLVLIGVAAGSIVQILPSPPSGTRHVSKCLSRSLRTLSDHYALLLSCWVSNGDEGKVVSESIWLELTESLISLEKPMFNIQFEFSSSQFDSESLGQVKQICHSINAALARLFVASATLPQEYKERLGQHLGVLDHRCIGEVMCVLAVCEQALLNGDAPPEILPTPLVQHAFEYWRFHSADYTLSAEMVRHGDYRRYCIALGAYVRFLGQIDALVLVIKGVLGESHLVSEDLNHLV
ncbi:hypothetical protein AbraIFM66950_007669 [Aspergillus brasiliensis]|nr:hypothetical protein AbraIFM66950_007669 [Aspergillus brasiliensis]